MEKYGTARLATDVNAIHPMCFACWMVHTVVPVIRLAYGQRNWSLSVFWQPEVPFSRWRNFGVYQSLNKYNVWEVMFWLPGGHHTVLTSREALWSCKEWQKHILPWNLGRGSQGCAMEENWEVSGDWKVSVVIKNWRWRHLSATEYLMLWTPTKD